MDFLKIRKMLKNKTIEEKYNDPLVQVEKAFLAAAHDYFMGLPHSYFLKGPNYERYK